MNTDLSLAAGAGETATPALVVGIGASAGGLEALERFFQHVPTSTGMAFVVVQHLSPDFKSLMDDILARRTTIPIRVAEDGIALEPDTIYLNRPKSQMIVSGGLLLLVDKDPNAGIAYPIDHFLRSLANDAPSRCAAIIFSGTGSDGSRGVRDVQRAGGLVIAQEPSTATFDGMPNSAIDTGSVDLTLPPEQMGDALVAFLEHRRAGRDGVPVPSGSGLASVFRLLHDAYGIDFASYKLPTVARRTERRIQACGARDLDAYVERLRQDPIELDMLYRDLLIGVTQFFRDHDAFDLLAATVVPELLARLSPGEELRAWVAGCASGEEAYSIAIVVRECLDALKLSNPVKIFATDVHHAALRFATMGIYDESSLADLSEQRRSRFFAPRDGGYQVLPFLRSMVVFASHNVLRDVPFTKLDLVSCRNMLIYLQPAAQRKVLSLFHFGLRASGTLFLGPSESLTDLTDEFEVVDSHWKVFRKRRDARLAPNVRAPLRTANLRARTDGPLFVSSPASGDQTLFAAYDALLDEYMPPSLLVGPRRNLLHAFGGANDFLRVPQGRATVDAVELLDDELRVAVTGALQRVFTEHQPIRYRSLRARRGDTAVVVDLTVREIKPRRGVEPCALVSLEEQGVVPVLPEIVDAPTTIDQASREQVTSLEAELRYTKENLQTTIEELETSNEELQSTNEELVASSEELQTTNEELHSVNQELFTVNAEFQKKITELTEVTADLDHLLASTEVDTLFLDRELRIRRFTPRMAQTFNLLTTDIGRRIDAFQHNLGTTTLIDDMRRVMTSGVPFEQTLGDADGSWRLLRVLPYRYRRRNTTDGAALTLIDITSMKKLEREARSKDELLSAILKNSPHPVFVRDTEGRFVLADESFRRLAGRDPAGLKPEQIFSVDVAAMLVRDDERIVRDRITVESEETWPTVDGPRTYLAVKFPMQDAGGKVVGVGGIATNVSSLKQAEAEARASVTRRDRFLAMLSHELRNPLAAILNAARVASMEDAHDVGDWLQIIRERAVHMNHLLDDLLDVARLTQDKLVLERKPLDLRTLVHGVLEEVRAKFDERGIHVSSEVEDVEVPVFGDPTRLHQLQVNLLTNAARYTPPGGRAFYALRRAGPHAEVTVADTGEGIAPDMLERIFDLFVQVDEPGARGRDAGLGIGLALVRRIAEMHGGSVSVASHGPGKGTEFRVLLPLVPDVQVAPVDAATLRRPARVLVVDDDKDNRRVMERLFQLDNVEVETAADGEEALTWFEAGPFDLVLLDLGLPNMDGYAVCQRLRALPKGRTTNIFALTGFSQPSDREATAAAGFDGHLTKPVDIDDIYRLYTERTARLPS